MKRDEEKREKRENENREKLLIKKRNGENFWNRKREGKERAQGNRREMKRNERIETRMRDKGVPGWGGERDGTILK